MRFNPFTGNFDLTGGTSGAATYGDKYVRTTRFESIGSGTSGTVTLPTSSEVVLDDFGGTVDAIVSQISGGKPTYRSATTTSGEVIATTFDSSGNWSLTGTPSSYPVAIIYRVRQQLSDFDSTSSNIIGIPTVDTTSMNVQIFTSSGTWTKPANAKKVRIFALGAGGGGGSGRKGAAASVRCGGGGGAAGAFVFGEFDADTLTSTVAVTVGAGGTGGPGITLNNTSGNDGVAGGDSTFGNYLKAPGGSFGRAGTAISGTAGTVSLGSSSPWNFAQNAGGPASATGGVGTLPAASAWLAPNGGGAGGGITSGDAASNGTNGGAINSVICPSLVVTGGTAGASATANGGNGNTGTIFYGVGIGSGGGSSRGNTTGNSGNGGNGGTGAGGAGSGATVNDVGNTGAGGNGGNGWLIVETYF